MTDLTQNSSLPQDERSAFESAYAAEFSNARVQVYTAKDIASMREGDGYGERPYLNGQWKGWQARAALALDDTPTPPEALATKLIDTWRATHGGQIPWEKAVEITAIATSMSSEERERLLAMTDAPEDEGLDKQASDPACEAIRYALEECEDDHDAIQFLKYWNEGEFDILRRNWPNLTDELFIGADPLFKPTTGVES